MSDACSNAVCCVDGSRIGVSEALVVALMPDSEKLSIGWHLPFCQTPNAL